MAKSIREAIQECYGNIAKRVSANAKNSPCSGGDCCNDSADESDLYTAEYIAGLPVEAISASLGCANPVALANLQKGEVVLDLGSGGGIDVLISAKYVSDTGKAYGLDMTDEMLALANRNKAKSGAQNVEFIKGYIENIPLADEAVDVVTSNCVINLTESKEAALAESYRVLKQGGRLAIADIVGLKPIPDEIRQNVAMWVGCVSGALSVEEYKRVLEKVGFKGVEITPVNIYTTEAIKGCVVAKECEKIFSKLDGVALDGAFAGAHVKAYK